MNANTMHEPKTTRRKAPDSKQKALPRPAEDPSAFMRQWERELEARMTRQMNEILRPEGHLSQN